MRDRIGRALPAACGFGVVMAGRGAYGLAAELSNGTFKFSDLGVVLAAFAVSTAIALPLVVSNLDKPNANPLEMSPWSGWLLAGILVVWGGAALWLYPEPHTMRDSILAAVAFIALFLAIYRVARSRGWTRS